MCRLLAVASPEPQPIAHVLGPDQPRVFHDMARLHDDGWGHAWLDESGALQCERIAESGLHHPGLVAALTSLRSRAHLVHLRFATNGLACTINNTHPFQADGMAFAHNGSLMPPALLEPLIRDDIPMNGSTDSERYFGVIRSELRSGCALETAIARAVAAIRGVFPRSSLNAIVLTRQCLVAIHASANAPSPWRELRARTPGLELPEAHDDRYFRMHINREHDGSVAIASSGMDVSDWVELPPESLTTVNLRTLRERTTLLG